MSISRLNRLASAVLFILATHVYAVTPAIVELTDVHYGELVPKSGFCELAPADGSLSSPTTMCLGPARLGHYRITADPNTNLRVRFSEVQDAARGLLFQPTVRMENNLGHSVLWLFTNSETTFSTGSDGLIDIYVGGRLTTSNGLNSSDSYSLSFDVDFYYAP